VGTLRFAHPTNFRNSRLNLIGISTSASSDRRMFDDGRMRRLRATKLGFFAQAAANCDGAMVHERHE
jgi:hypothetical protein